MIDRTDPKNRFAELAEKAAQENRIIWTSEMIDGNDKITRIMSADRETAGVLLNHSARMIYGAMEHVRLVSELMVALQDKLEELDKPVMRAIAKIAYLSGALEDYERANLDLTQQILGTKSND
jgi:Fe-S oxidoreductase